MRLSRVNYASLFYQYIPCLEITVSFIYYTQQYNTVHYYYGSRYGPAFLQSDWLIAGPYNTMRTTFFKFCRKASIFQVFRCFGIGSSQISIKLLSCLIFGHFNTGKTICNFYPVLFSDTLIPEKQFVNIRTTYQ